MDIRPLHDRVVLKRDERQRHSPGGILIPDTAGEKPTEGRVMAVGKGKILENGKIRPMDLIGCSSENTAAPRSKSPAKG